MVSVKGFMNFSIENLFVFAVAILHEDLGVEHVPIDAGYHYLLRGIALFCIISFQGATSW